MSGARARNRVESEELVVSTPDAKVRSISVSYGAQSGNVELPKDLKIKPKWSNPPTLIEVVSFFKRVEYCSHGANEESVLLQATVYHELTTSERLQSEYAAQQSVFPPDASRIAVLRVTILEILGLGILQLFQISYRAIRGSS